MKLVIAEKPSMASDIARVIGASQKESGYFLGNDYAVTWAYGHLIELYNKESESGKWKDVPLPITSVLQLRPKDGAGKQLAIIDKLSKQCIELICACDAGREGELIFRLIIHYLSINKPIKRLWISSLTDSAIRAGFASLKLSSDYDYLYIAARARAEADWYVGVNATRALTLAANSGDVYSLGRVQTPTLSMICSRYLDHNNFVPSPYWVLLANCEMNQRPFKMRSKKYMDNGLAESDLSKCSGHPLLITSVTKNEHRENPPLLYDLTGLQKEASRVHGITPDKTLELAQSLYEKKYLSYPRTGSSYIPEDVFEMIPSLIETVMNLDLSINVTHYRNSSNKTLFKGCVNDAKVTDHHALLPTGVLPDFDTLSKPEYTIYMMVVARMFQAFHLPCVKETMLVVGCSNDVEFKTKGSVILSPGWREVIKRTLEDDEKEEDLPMIDQGDELRPRIEVEKNMTKPKPLLTDSTLLAFMETAGKDIEDTDAREAMADTGIGTPATRDSIIKTLLDKKYILREKKTLIPTQKGLETYAKIASTPIASANLTGEWEAALSRISSKSDYDKFINQVMGYASSLVSILSSTPPVEKKQFAQGPKCPKCGQQLRFFEKGLGCTKECEFVVWRQIASKSLTDTQLSHIVENGESKELSGFKSKTGKTFTAKLKLVDNKVEFVFSNTKR